MWAGVSSFLQSSWSWVKFWQQEERTVRRAWSWELANISSMDGEPLVPSLSWRQEGWGQEQAGTQPRRVLLNLLEVQQIKIHLQSGKASLSLGFPV